MTHQEIEQREVIEDYVRGRLAPEERLAFQEHFFVCDRCFEQVQTMERFVAGVRHAAEAGLLEPQLAGRAEATVVPVWLNWLRPAFAVTAAAALVLAAAVGWLLLYRVPQLRTELARERQAQEQSQQQDRQSLDQTLAELQRERQQRAELENQLAAARSATQPVPPGGPEPNLPLVMLEASREAGAANQLALTARAKSVVLWIDPGPGADFGSFRLVVQTPEGQTVQTVEGLRRNSYGALAVSLPAQLFQGASYRLKLYGVSGRPATLVTEYKLQIRKKQ